MYLFKNFIIPVLLLSFITSCIPPEEGSFLAATDKVVVDPSNKEVQKIFEFRDRRMKDSLIIGLKSRSATVRYLSALAFASFGDSTAVPALGQVLVSDNNTEVRLAAAFSLGQTKSAAAEPWLIKGFVSSDSLSEKQRLNAVILESIGKCGTTASLTQIAGVSTYKNTDTLLLEGQCRAVYQFGLRGKTDLIATNRMIDYVTTEAIPEPARLIAAHALGRTKDIVPDSAQSVQIAAGFVRSSNPGIRTALAKALGKSSARSNSSPAFRLLSNAISTEPDWQVKCAIVQSLSKFNYDTVRTLVVPMIADANPHVSRVAAEFFIENGQASDGDFYWRISRDYPNLPWPARIALFHASNKWLSGYTNQESKDFINFQLRDMFLKSGDPYEQAACLRALSEFGWQYKWIYEKGKSSPFAVVKSASAESLTKICNKKDFYAAFGEGARGARRELYYYLRDLVASGDAGVISEAAPGFMSELLNFREVRDSVRTADLQNTLNSLKMPRDVEAAQALEKAIAYFEGLPEPKFQAPKFNHPIEWSAFALIKPASRAKVQTTQGSFEIRFYPEWAPGSMLNFVQLAKDGFFDNKFFHRVVPGFVIQTGCPRGDGYGAQDYTIRTEIGPVWYDGPGWVGMASAGNDTEGTQWFVTHTATPHLDGRYTIFGKISEGMAVVDKIQVGDKITKVEIVP